MAISKVHFPWLVLTVALMFDSVPAQGPLVPTVYEFCRPDNRFVIVNATSPFIIQSPNYRRDNYPDGVDCSLTIATHQDNVVLSYNFSYFDVEYQRFCGYDYLAVNGIKYCGSWEVGRVLPSYLPQHSMTFLFFTTDSSVRKTGFEILVTPEVIIQEEDDVTSSK